MFGRSFSKKNDFRKRVNKMKERIKREETVYAQTKFQHWSPAADRFLAAHLYDGLDFLCRNLGRTYGGITIRAERLGLPYKHLWNQRHGQKRQSKS